MTQDKAPEWAKAEGHRIAMELVPSMALTFDHSHGLKDYDARKAAELPFRQIAQHEIGPAIALALSQAYERGQESMRERAVEAARCAAKPHARDFMNKNMNATWRAASKPMALLAIRIARTIRSLPIEQDSGEVGK